VSWISANRAYVGSERDREIISLSIGATKIRVTKRMPVHGQPVALLANRNGSRLYAALDNTDQVAILDTARDTLIEEFNVVAPEAIYPNGKRLGGANSDALALTPDERTLLVSNGGENAIAVVRLSDRARSLAAERKTVAGFDDDDRPGADHSSVIGLVPTGWYPVGVATSKDGSTWYVANAKSEVGPTVNWCTNIDSATGTCIVQNPPVRHMAENGHYFLRNHDEQILQLQKAGFLTMPAPDSLGLARLTKQVARNNRFDQPETDAKNERLFSFLREHIKHVIYIVKENRTYDQILGDLEIGNGDPRLTIFPEKLSPNHHAIARGFTTLDNFVVSAEGSWTGWDWSAAARTNDFTERFDRLDLAARGPGGEYFSTDRGLHLILSTSAERHAEYSKSPTDPDILPGTRAGDELDGPGGGVGKGYIWDAALRRGLTVRNYGFFPYGEPEVPSVHDPFAQKLKVYYPANSSLAPVSDPYYHLWTPAYPDYWRYREWKREFDQYSASKTLPNLMLIQLGNDHLGAFDIAIDGVNTPETQMGDNDYALGQIVEAVAKSPFASDTLIVSIEDDTWDGPDHVNAFRSVALLAGPYVRQHALVSTRYTTVSIVKTIEEILGLEPIGLNDALAAPMSDVFDPAVSSWSYRGIIPEMLRSTQLPLPPAEHACIVTPKRSNAYWAKAMAGQDFSGVDRADPLTFNRALWRGLKGDVPYPTLRTQSDLRANRPEFLAQTHSTQTDACRPR
jgi:DNA-binding beta-propeller fold protein YncE